MHGHYCMDCGKLIAESDFDCEQDRDHDFGRCDDCATADHDVYLCLAETPHGRRYSVVSSDCRASVSLENLRHVLGPAIVGPSGYPNDADAGQAIADLAEVDLDDDGVWSDPKAADLVR